MSTFVSPQTGSEYTVADGQSLHAPAFVCYRHLDGNMYRIRVQASSRELRDAIRAELPGAWGTGESGGEDHLSAVATSAAGLARAIADAIMALNAVLPQPDGGSPDGGSYYA